MPRAVIDLNTSSGLAAVKGRWKYAQGLVPGEPNEGLVSQLEGSPARLPDYDDSGWEVCQDLGKWVSHGFSFVWYRINLTFPETVEGHPTTGVGCNSRPASTTTESCGSTGSATGTGAPYRGSTCPSGC